MACGIGQGVDVVGGEIGQGIHLQVAPDLLDGIEFGRIGRQEFIV